MGCSKQFAAEAVLMKQDIFAFDICEDHEKFPAWATLRQAWFFCSNWEVRSFLQPNQTSLKHSHKQWNPIEPWVERKALAWTTAPKDVFLLHVQHDYKISRVPPKSSIFGGQSVWVIWSSIRPKQANCDHYTASIEHWKLFAQASETNICPGILGVEEDPFPF